MQAIDRSKTAKCERYLTMRQGDKFIPKGDGGWSTDVIFRKRKYLSERAAKCAVGRMKFLGWDISPIYPNKRNEVVAVRTV